MNTLPEGWVIVLCGNPSEYNKSARKFDYAILDRLRRLPIEFRIEDFLQYAKERNFEKAIQNYVEVHSENIYVCSHKTEDNLATARAWENLDIAVKMLALTGGELDEKMVAQFIKSDKIANDFYIFYVLQTEHNFTKNDLENILNGYEPEKYLARILKMKPFMQLNVVETATKMVMENILNQTCEKSKVKMQLNHTIRFFRDMNDTVCAEKMFHLLGDNLQVMDFLQKECVTEYIQLAKAMYSE